MEPKFAAKLNRHSGQPGEGRGRPGIQKFQRHLDAGFHRHDGTVAVICSTDFGSATWITGE